MRPAISSKTSRLGSDSRKPSNTRLAVSPLKYQSKSTPPSPSPCPGPGSRPVMQPSTETASAVKTLLMVSTLGRRAVRWLERIVHVGDRGYPEGVDRAQAYDERLPLPAL